MRVFGFARRRRHTRYWRDWSSDVCSSDLRSLSIEGHPSAQGALEVTDRADQPDTGPISPLRQRLLEDMAMHGLRDATRREDRKSTRLNSSHANISYAVFCLKKKTTNPNRPDQHPGKINLRG